VIDGSYNPVLNIHTAGWNPMLYQTILNSLDFFIHRGRFYVSIIFMLMPTMAQKDILLLMWKFAVLTTVLLNSD
jgi:hypothetical protein